MIGIRNTRPEDAQAVVDLARRGFADSPDMKVWSEENIRHHVEAFPEGQFVAVNHAEGDAIVGSATTMRVPVELALRRHTWREVTGGSNLANHDPEGGILYGVDVVVRPRDRHLGVGRLLYRARRDLLQRTDCPGFAAGGRLPNYHNFANYGLPADEYVRLVEQRVVRDPVLSFQLANGMTPLDVLPGYLTDAKSGNWACLILLPNPARPDGADLVREYRRFPWERPKARAKPPTPAPEVKRAVPVFGTPREGRAPDMRGGARAERAR